MKIISTIGDRLSGANMRVEWARTEEKIRRAGSRLLTLGFVSIVLLVE
jgi:hypothetical protein